MKEIGVKTIIYTDISKDGMLTGVNIKATKELIDETGMDIVASGSSKSGRFRKVSKINAEG